MATTNPTLGLARPLTEAELEAFRSAVPPGPGPHTAEKVSRAQCDAQLRISATTDEEGPPSRSNPTRGVLLRPRSRPAPIELSEEARRNDVNEYNTLLDLRAYSPNRRPVGFSHLDPEQIARENSFPMANFPAHPDEAPHRSPSPLPEEGSLAYIFAGSLGDEMRRQNSSSESDSNFNDYGVVDAYAPRRIPPQDPSLRPEEVPAVTRRLRALPVPYSEFVIALRTREHRSWEEAFYLAEQSRRTDGLVPSQRRIYAQVAIYRDRAHLGLEVEDGKRVLYHNACVEMFQAMGNDGSASYLAARAWMGGDQNVLGERYMVRDLWWNLVFAFWKDDRPERVLTLIVLHLYRVFRCAMFQRLEDKFQFWLDMAGDVGAEMERPEEDTSFWRAWEAWEEKLRDADDFCEYGEETVLEQVRAYGSPEEAVRDLKTVMWVLPYPLGVDTEDADIDYEGVGEEFGDGDGESGEGEYDSGSGEGNDGAGDDEMEDGVE